MADTFLVNDSGFIVGGPSNAPDAFRVGEAPDDCDCECGPSVPGCPGNCPTSIILDSSIKFEVLAAPFNVFDMTGLFVLSRFTSPATEWRSSTFTRTTTGGTPFPFKFIWGLICADAGESPPLIGWSVSGLLIDQSWQALGSQPSFVDAICPPLEWDIRTDGVSPSFGIFTGALTTRAG